jgi:hypothetical protein
VGRAGYWTWATSQGLSAAARCLPVDPALLPSLFDVDAVLLAEGTSQVRGRSGIAEVIIDHLRRGGSYVAASPLVTSSRAKGAERSGQTLAAGRAAEWGLWEFHLAGELDSG